MRTPDGAPSRFPRLAVVARGCIEDVTGGGITLGSLLEGWPPDRLGVVSEYFRPPQLERSTWNYQLGSEEYRLVAPLPRGLTRFETSGAVTPSRWHPVAHSTSSDTGPSTGHTGVCRGSVGMLRRYWKSTSGQALRETLRPLRLSRNLRAWFRDFRPDLVYGQPSSLGTIRLLLSIREEIGVPLAFHVMDDWPAVAYQRGLLHRRVHRQTMAAFAELVAASEACIAIGDAMAEQYQAVYGREFESFQNCVALEQYRAVGRCEWERSDVFHVAYRGRIGLAVERSLLDLAESIGRLRSRGMSITLDVTTPDVGSGVARRLAVSEHVAVTEPGALDALPRALASADALVLPYDFDPRSQAFIRLSVPTKLPEYLASGTPVLVYAPEDTAVVRYARKDGWGMVVPTREPSMLDSALARIYEDSGLRRSLGEAGRATASRNHDAAVVRERFRHLLAAVASGHRSP